MSLRKATLTLDPDVATRVKMEAANHRIAFKTLVNEALRLGLDAYAMRAKAAQPYRTQPVAMDLKAGFSYDNTGDLLAQCEGAFIRNPRASILFSRHRSHTSTA